MQYFYRLLCLGETMMIFNNTEQQEREYLQKIVGLLNAAINNTDLSVKEY
jgi:DNA helicase-2/ATP-dependent DNA helicase PcrA